jgi:predicted ArsR family transcriptional regulator
VQGQQTFFDPDSATLARRSDPPTSKAAARVAGRLGSHRRRVLEVLGEYQMGVTHEEAAERAGLEPDQTWKRLSDLKRTGLAEVLRVNGHDVTRLLRSGSPGDVYVITRRGLSALRRAREVA